jgi:NADH-quinone oxidoreductase subunit N
MLALAALDPEAWQPARLWILVFVVTRSAFAAWAAGIRAQFWTGRIPDLRGWARRSPILALAFVPIVIASVGFPGLASFDARRSLIGLSLDGPFATIVFVGTIAPLAYYGRLLAVGLRQPDRLGAAGGTWMPRFEPVDLTALGPWLRTTADVNRAVSTAAIALLLGSLALGTAAGWFGGPASAAGLPPSLEAPTEFFVPEE